MTKKNKLLSLVCLAVLSIVCACGVMFSGSALSAKAEGITAPTPNVTNVEATNLRISSGQGYLANNSAPGDGASWVIFDYNPVNNGLRGGNPANSFHMAVTNNGGFGTGAMPANIGNYVTTIDHVRVLVNIETGEAYYERNSAAAVLFATLTLPAFAEGQYPTVTMLFNGFEAMGSPAATDGITCLRLSNLKVYDDLGNDLGLKTHGSFVLDFPAPIVSDVEATNLKISSGQGYMANVNAPAAEASWVIFDYNPVNNGLRGGNPQNAFHMAVKNDGSFGTGAMPLYTGNYVTTAEHVRVLVNIKTGEAYYERNGTPTLFTTFTLPAFGEGQYPTVTMLFNGFESAGSAGEDGITCLSLNNLKVYDDLGNDLGVKTSGSWFETVNVTLTSTSVSARPGSNDYLMFWEVRDVDADELIYPSFSLGSAQNLLNIDGEDVQTQNVSSAYTYTERHMWQFRIDTLDPNYTNMYDVEPVQLYFKAGYQIKSGNVIYILKNAVYVYFSGSSVAVSDSPRKEVSLLTEDPETAIDYASASVRFQGDIYATVDTERTEIPIYNILLKKNGTDDTLVWFEHNSSVSISYASVSEFGSYSSSADIEPSWYLLPAGSVIGNVYVTDVDYIIQINKSTFNIFPKDKVFNVNFANLQGADAPAATTFSYADADFNVELPSISNPEGFVFGGWTYGGGDITAITPGMFGEDVTVTAKLSDGEAAFDIQEKASVILQSSIALTFYVKATVYDVNTLTANFAFAYADDLTKTAVGEFVENSRVNDNVAFYTVTYYGILPQHLADDVTLTVKNGEVVLDTYSASVVDYISALLAVTDPEVAGTDVAGLALLKTLACDLVEYGTAMQEMISHDLENTPKAVLGEYDNVATEFVSAEGADDYTKVGEADVSYYWKGATFVYNNVPQLVFTFVAPETANLAVTLNFAGEDDVYTADSVVKVSDNAGEGLAVYSVTYNFVPYTFDKVVEVKIFDAEVQMGQTLEYSVNAYIANILETVTAEELATLKAIYNYGVSAKAYNAYVTL